MIPWSMIHACMIHRHRPIVGPIVNRPRLWRRSRHTMACGTTVTRDACMNGNYYLITLKPENIHILRRCIDFHMNDVSHWFKLQTSLQYQWMWLWWWVVVRLEEVQVQPRPRPPSTSLQPPAPGCSPVLVCTRTVRPAFGGDRRRYELSTNCKRLYIDHREIPENRNQNHPAMDPRARGLWL